MAIIKYIVATMVHSTWSFYYKNIVLSRQSGIGFLKSLANMWAFPFISFFIIQHELCHRRRKKMLMDEK